MPLRELFEHRLEHSKYEGIAVYAISDNKTAGGVPARYVIDLMRPTGMKSIELPFMTAPYDEDIEVGGVTNEALLAIVLDRLRGFQAGPYPCRENAIAITEIEHGMLRLQARSRRLTAEREALEQAKAETLVSDNSPPVLSGNEAT